MRSLSAKADAARVLQGHAVLAGLKIVINGAGASGIACTELFKALGGARVMRGNSPIPVEHVDATADQRDGQRLLVAKEPLLRERVKGVRFSHHQP